MEIEFSEEQELLRKTVRDFVARECPKTKARELEEDCEKGYSPEVWRGVAELGWLGLIIPERYGGMGMKFQDLAIVLEEMGRNVFPGPFFCTVLEGCIPIMVAGTEEQKKELLPGIAKGELIMSMALLEANGCYAASGIAAKAVPRDAGFGIDGTKLFVEMAHVADRLICVARTEEGVLPETGITLFLVDTKSPGVCCEVMPTIGMEKLCEVCFSGVVVRGEDAIGQMGEGWPVVAEVLRKAAIAKCAESVGGMEASLDMTVAYCKERVQYDRPIGAFQALQHMMADMLITLETTKYLVYEAAWLESEGLASAREAAMAKAYVNEAYKKVTERAVALHGGIGTSRDHDIGLYYRRAKAAEIAFGDSDFQRELVARNIGLLS